MKREKNRCECDQAICTNDYEMTFGKVIGGRYRLDKITGEQKPVFGVFIRGCNEQRRDD